MGIHLSTHAHLASQDFKLKKAREATRKARPKMN